MEEKELKMLVALRSHVISEYKLLDGLGNPSSVVKQADIGLTLESIVRSLDDVLSKYVNFE
tara:strand:+ start:6330 stop:6512 length:183 start_codon:yes stop_codon:yes gene_type:complete